MDSLKPYAEYKPSGVDWLGDIPKGWEVKRLGIGYNITLGKMLQPMPKSDNDISVPYYRALNVQWEEITNDVKEMWASPEEIRFFSIEKGDLLVCEGGEVGRASIVNSISNTIIFQNALHRVRAKKGFSVEFLLRVLEHVAYSDWFSVLCNKATIAHFTSDKFKSLICAFPTLPEQQAIANFLDQKCASIDSLIKKKQQFLELLEEKRRTLITHAVTRGLDASAPLKASGVDWLGDIPKGWEVKRLKFCVTNGFQYGANIAAESTDLDQPRYIRITDMNDDGTLKEETFRSLPYEDAMPYILQNNDILLARSGATVGKSFLFKQKMGIAAYAGYLIRIAINKEVLPEYVYACVNSDSYWQWISSIAIQATIQNVSAEKYANFYLALPPLPEQQAIVDYLDTETAAIDKQKKHVQASIELLKEYRASLITHAVTGKIDVRDMVTQ